MIKSLTFLSTPTPSTTPFRCRATVATPPPPNQVSGAASRKRATGSLYEVLRLKQSASTIEIKSAYRTLAKVYHPDATLSRPSIAVESDGCDFFQIHNAYETLSDPATRAVYDLSLGLNSNLRFNSGGFRGYSSGRVRRTTTRRWETDQCW